ncbi:hypothetical protein OAY06_01420 [bacterium]|nr:hypothetical protein [bacterium]
MRQIFCNERIGKMTLCDERQHTGEQALVALPMILAPDASSIVQTGT